MREPPAGGRGLCGSERCVRRLGAAAPAAEQGQGAEAEEAEGGGLGDVDLLDAEAAEREFVVPGLRAVENDLDGVAAVGGDQEAGAVCLEGVGDQLVLAAAAGVAGGEGGVADGGLEDVVADGVGDVDLDGLALGVLGIEEVAGDEELALGQSAEGGADDAVVVLDVVLADADERDSAVVRVAAVAPVDPAGGGVAVLVHVVEGERDGVAAEGADHRG